MSSDTKQKKSRIKIKAISMQVQSFCKTNKLPMPISPLEDHHQAAKISLIHEMFENILKMYCFQY